MDISKYMIEIREIIEKTFYEMDENSLEKIREKYNDNDKDSELYTHKKDI